MANISLSKVCIFCRGFLILKVFVQIQISFVEWKADQEPTKPTQSQSQSQTSQSSSGEKDELSALKSGLRKVKIFTEYVSIRRGKNVKMIMKVGTRKAIILPTVLTQNHLNLNKESQTKSNKITIVSEPNMIPNTKCSILPWKRRKLMQNTVVMTLTLTVASSVPMNLLGGIRPKFSLLRSINETKELLVQVHAPPFIAALFQNNQDLLPIKSQLDSLIQEGSLEWRNLCENETYGFQIGTLILKPFLKPIYDRFFVLKVDSEAYYIIDTLGERLFEGCNQAYILKFDRHTTIYELSSFDSGSDEQKPWNQSRIRVKTRLFVREKNLVKNISKDSWQQFL